LLEPVGIEAPCQAEPPPLDSSRPDLFEAVCNADERVGHVT